MSADYQKEIIKLIRQLSHSRGEYQVFNDWLEMSAIAISNSADPTHRAEREQRYLDIIGTYSKNEQQIFPQMFSHLVEGLQNKIETHGTEDVLGVIFHELELHNKYKGQFFTPQSVSDCMAFMTFNDLKKVVEENGFISALEPACGSGVMVTSMCKAMQKAELNYSTQLVVTAVDVDLKCVHMTYLQLALYGIPAVVIHGNSLTCEEFSRWYTPVYLLNGWIWKQQCGISNKFCVEDEIIKRASEPMYAVWREVEKLTADINPPPPPMKEIQIEDKPIVKGEQMSLFEFS
jgi:hypothetical protein